MLKLLRQLLQRLRPGTRVLRRLNDPTASLAGSSGVETPDDVVKYLLAGADAVMTTAALLRHGPAYAGVLLEGLADWLTRKEFASVADIRGLLAVPADADANAVERSGYLRAIEQAKLRYGPHTH